VSKDWRPASPWDPAIAVTLFAVGLYELFADPIADDVLEGPTGLNVVAIALAAPRLEQVLQADGRRALQRADLAHCEQHARHE
jgi:hypothetical protein